MGKRFTKSGRLKIPLTTKVELPPDKIEQQAGEIIIKEAYCHNGHSLMSEEIVDGAPGIKFLYMSQETQEKTLIVISAIVGKCEKRIINGTPFEQGDIIHILCPECETRLPVLFDCECGAPIYIFYIDNERNHNYAQSVCSRIGCVRASKLRFSSDALREFMDNHGF